MIPFFSPSVKVLDIGAFVTLAEPTELSRYKSVGV